MRKRCVEDERGYCNHSLDTCPAINKGEDCEHYIDSKGKRFGIAETIVVSLVIFLGTGVYNMYKLYKEVKVYKAQDEQVQVLEDKYCNIQNPTYEQQAMCIDVLKTHINKEDK